MVQRDRLESATKPSRFTGLSECGGFELERDARRYRLLRDYLLLNGFIRHVKLPARESEPFVLGNAFYGPTFGDAVDTLKTEGNGSIPAL